MLLQSLPHLPWNQVRSKPRAGIRLSVGKRIRSMNIINTKLTVSPQMHFRLYLLGTIFLLLFHSCIRGCPLKSNHPVG